ncbi:alpha/beta hydrolase fold protein [Halothece sp. PCC 7418]|uniref:YheT family hydrolase n=1 Tax=Halothece sp. (strain PCC 7418) TaxID=65093 RepID=UPI0002A07F60|nr:alpha/beta fold hydrolase [Halothece sp. PCC 7418]AFZ42334.1 alpha/beta hydrolase fold protein [Halothece sp. PCC 7418]
MTTSFTSYTPPRYLRNGIVQTIATTYWYGKTWEIWKEQVGWLPSSSSLPWEEKVFLGAEDVPLWGKWACPPNADGTIIINYGITGNTEQSWYAYLTAHKAYTQGWAVLLYDWRGHGKSAELSPVPMSDGWWEGLDQVRLAEQLVTLGCPEKVVLIGFSLGGQVALWGLKAAQENRSFIQAAATLTPNLESNWTLDYLVSYPFGRIVENKFARELREEARKKAAQFPESVDPRVVDRIDSIRSFDREIVINYYGFASDTEYYDSTAGLYLLDQLQLPYLIVYAADDPIFEPRIIPEMKRRVEDNSYGHLLLTNHGGHVSHISQNNGVEDQFWGINRLLEFLNQI